MRDDLNTEPGHAELASQVTHPLADYQPGSARLEKLYVAMETANKFTFPPDFSYNV